MRASFLARCGWAAGGSGRERERERERERACNMSHKFEFLRPESDAKFDQVMTYYAFHARFRSTNKNGRQLLF